MRNNNKYITLGENTIIIMKGNKKTTISTECIEKIKSYTWCVEGTGYVMSKTGGRSVKLHRIIIGAKKGEFVDHIDGNPLNNTLDNLRICRKQQNEFNTKIRCDNTSGYKGVCRSKNGRYRAYISLNGTQHGLGTYNSKKEAAKAYNKAALDLFGDYARLNVII